MSLLNIAIKSSRSLLRRSTLKITLLSRREEEIWKLHGRVYQSTSQNSGYFGGRNKAMYLALLGASAGALLYLYFGLKPANISMGEQKNLDILDNMPSYGSPDLLEDTGHHHSNDRSQRLTSEEETLYQATQDQSLQSESLFKQDISSLDNHIDGTVHDEVTRNIYVQDGDMNKISSDTLSQSIKNLVKEGMILGDVYDELNRKLGLLIEMNVSQLSSSSIIDVPLGDVIVSLNQDWINASLLSKVFSTRSKSYINEYNRISNLLLQEGNEIASELVEQLEQSYQYYSTLMESSRKEIFDKIEESIEIDKDALLNQRKLFYNNSYEEEIADFDIKILFYYIIRKLKFYESVHHDKLKEIVTYLVNEKKKQLHWIQESEKINELKATYEDLISKIQVENAKEMVEKVNEYTTAYIRNYISLQTIQLLESLENQKKDMQQAYEINTNLLESKLRSKISHDYAPLEAKLNAFQRSVSLINDTIEMVVDVARLHRDAYALRQALLSFTSNGRCKPLGPFIESLKSNSVDDNQREMINAVASVFSLEALNYGVYTESNLLMRLGKVVNQCKRSVLIRDKTPTPLRRILAFIHSILYLPPSPLQSMDMNDVQNQASKDIFQMYAILESVDKSISNGDLRSCLKQMSQLSGYPRQLTEQWISDATAHIEAVNASEFLLAAVSNFVISSSRFTAEDIVPPVSISTP